jgi:hypothetical protein
MARLGPMRVPISRAMSRPSSARPKSPANMRTDLLKKIVSVKAAVPCAFAFHTSGLS